MHNTKSQPSISITIPVYNEAAIVANAVYGLVETLEGAGVTFEIILAENGSIDSTSSIVDQLSQNDHRIVAIHLPRPDYGRALRQGFVLSSGVCLANFPIDYINVEFLLLALTRLAEYDLVLGSKYIAQSRDRRSTARRTGGLLLSSLVRLLFRIPTSDTHGLLVLRRDTVAPLVKKCTFGHEIFDTELVVRSYKARLSICELPIDVKEIRPSRIASLHRARRMLIELARLRIRLWMEGIRRQ